MYADDRERWREEYARQYPEGLKRKRDGEQREKQRVSQRAYEKKRSGKLRRLTDQVRYLARGRGRAAEALVGCSREEFGKHIRDMLGDNGVARFTLKFHRQPNTYNLEDEKECKKAFHYTNIWVKRRDHD